MTGGQAVAPTALVPDVAALFSDAPDLEALALAENGRPSGLITRKRLFRHLAADFGRESAVRKSIADVADLVPLVLPEDTDAGEAVARALARPGDTTYDEVIVVGADGRYRGLLSLRRLLMHQALALAQSQLERQEARARVADLERLDAKRSQFLAHVAHELRSPLAVIAAAAEVVRGAVNQGAWEVVQTRLAVLLRAVTSLQGSVENVLDLFSLEAGKVGVTVGLVESLPLLEEVAAAASLLVGKKDVAVSVHRPTPPPVVASDRDKLRQILMNLASNAVKFTESGRIELGAESERGAVRFWVSDTGIGIREEDIRRLFGPFERIPTPGRPCGGTGLGLVIARSLAELLGGRIAVSSRYGEGTTFVLHLPAAGVGSAWSKRSSADCETVPFAAPGRH